MSLTNPAKMIAASLATAFALSGCVTPNDYPCDQIDQKFRAMDKDNCMSLAAQGKIKYEDCSCSHYKGDGDHDRPSNSGPSDPGPGPSDPGPGPGPGDPTAGTEAPTPGWN